MSRDKYSDDHTITLNSGAGTLCVDGDLKVTGSVDSSGGLDISTDLNINGNLTVNGSIEADTVEADTVTATSFSFGTNLTKFVLVPIESLAEQIEETGSSGTKVQANPLGNSVFRPSEIVIVTDEIGALNDYEFNFLLDQYIGMVGFARLTGLQLYISQPNQPPPAPYTTGAIDVQIEGASMVDGDDQDYSSATVVGSKLNDSQPITAQIGEIIILNFDLDADLIPLLASYRLIFQHQPPGVSWLHIHRIVLNIEYASLNRAAGMP